jgi:hypothetical protein
MNTVLYYPHLFPPMDWVRVAALCWDEVHTLRPAGSPAIPDELAELDAALGGILRTDNVSDTRTDPEFLGMFKEWLQDTLGDGQLTKDKEGEWFAILRPKMDEQLERILYEHGLAKYGLVETPVRVARWMKSRVERVTSGEHMVQQGPLNVRGKLYRRYQALLERARGASNPQEKETFWLDANKFREKNMVKAVRHDEHIFLPKRIALNYISLLS